MHRGQPAEMNVVSEDEEHVGIDNGAGRQKELLLLTESRRYPYLHIYFMYVLRVFLTS